MNLRGGELGGRQTGRGGGKAAGVGEGRRAGGVGKGRAGDGGVGAHAIVIGRGGGQSIVGPGGDVCTDLGAPGKRAAVGGAPDFKACLAGRVVLPIQHDLREGHRHRLEIRGSGQRICGRRGRGRGGVGEAGYGKAITSAVAEGIELVCKEAGVGGAVGVGRHRGGGGGGEAGGGAAGLVERFV